VEAGVHVGGGQGFHQVIELRAGMTMFSNFREDATGARMEPLKTDADFGLGIGYGFGWGITERLQVVVLQDYGSTFHQRAGLSGSASGSVEQLVTRLGVRYDLGVSRRRPF
jgi:hypothetical protein